MARYLSDRDIDETLNVLDSEDDDNLDEDKSSEFSDSNGEDSGESDEEIELETNVNTAQLTGPCRVLPAYRNNAINTSGVPLSTWDWKHQVNNPITMDFVGSSGICPRVLRRLGAEPTEYDCFAEFFTDDFLAYVVQETNKYYHLCINNPLYNKKKSDEQWFDVTEDEIKVYLSLCVLMSQVKKPSLRQY